DQDGQITLLEPAKVRAHLIEDAGLTAEQIERVRSGMRKVVNEGGGTGGRARIKGVEVAGKTGTAQNWTVREGRRVKDNHVWFVAFAPYDKPRFAVAVLVQGAKSGGGVAAPIAGKILEDALALPATAPDQETPLIYAMANATEASSAPAGSQASSEPGPGEQIEEQAKKPEPFVIAKLDPAPGNFQFIESIDFGRAIPAATSLGEDSETEGSAGQGRAQAQQASARAEPNIREDADEGGRVQNKERQPSAFQRFFSIFGGNKERKENKKPEPPPRR
ncbi:MAG: penicillin-binding transpeptidase domain-containing protein, partial [Terrimicrobiaceae bacterium]|nr:penicillin-binding transpeptidase domain-containing protein [Terrimicrobiaceae bacterium]